MTPAFLAIFLFVAGISLGAMVGYPFAYDKGLKRGFRVSEDAHPDDLSEWRDFFHDGLRAGKTVGEAGALADMALRMIRDREGADAR